jgi:hypothetical protein
MREVKLFVLAFLSVPMCICQAACHTPHTVRLTIAPIIDNSNSGKEWVVFAAKASLLSTLIQINGICVVPRGEVTLAFLYESEALKSEGMQRLSGVDVVLIGRISKIAQSHASANGYMVHETEVEVQLSLVSVREGIIKATALKNSKVRGECKDSLHSLTCKKLDNAQLEKAIEDAVEQATSVLLNVKAHSQ